MVDNVLRKIGDLLQDPCADVSDGTVNYSWVRFMILDSLGCLLGLGSHSLIALSMHDRFWYRCLGDATHLLLGVSVYTLGQKEGLISHSLVGCLFACLIWDSCSHSLIALSVHDIGFGIDVLVMHLTCSLVYQLKVSKNQNGFMKTSFLPITNAIILRISAL